MAESRFVSAPYQEKLHEALQEVVNSEEVAVNDVIGTSVVLTKWCVLVEIMDTNGEKFITGYRGPTSNSIPVWDVQGLLCYALDHMEFQDGEDEDEED